MNTQSIAVEVVREITTQVGDDLAEGGRVVAIALVMAMATPPRAPG